MSEIAKQRVLLVGVGLLQGLIILWAAEVSQVVKHPYLFASLYFILSAGLTLQLSWNGKRILHVVVMSILVGLVFAGMAWWAASQLPEEGARWLNHERMGLLVPSVLLALYITIPFVQVVHEQDKLALPYKDLFRHAWNNFYIVLLAFTVMGIFWLVIVLWVALFRLIGISLFDELFFSKPFISLSLPIVFAYSLSFGLAGNKLINASRQFSLLAFYYLTPLLSAMIVLFVLSLPFTGVARLLDIGYASRLLLGTLAVLIFFINAVYQGGEREQPPYSKPVRWLVHAALILMPLLWALSSYALYLRIDQYGLTPERFIMVLLLVIAFVYAIGYAIAVVVRQRDWLGLIPEVNIPLALATVLTIVFVYTPVLDPVRWSVSSQVERLLQGKVTADKFDYGFLAFKSGHLGRQALERLAANQDHQQAAEIRKRAKAALESEHYYAWKNQRSKLNREDVLIKTERPVPEEVWSMIEQAYAGWNAASFKDAILIEIDMNADGEKDYVFIAGKNYHGLIYQFKQGKWAQAGRLYMRGGPRTVNLREALNDNAVNPVEPEFKDLELGGTRYYYTR